MCRVGHGGRGLPAGMAVAGALDGVADSLHLRVDVAAGRGEIAVPGEAAQGVRVHVRSFQPRPSLPDFMAAAFNVRYKSVQSVAPTFWGRMMPLVGQIRVATFVGSKIKLRE